MLQLSQRPLTGSDADRKLFVDRTAELGHLQRAAQLDFNVLLLGERGIGLTSLVMQHRRRLEDGDRPSFYVNGGRVDDLSKLATAIRSAVRGPRVVTDALAQRLRDEVGAISVGQDNLYPLRALRDLGTEARESGAPMPTVILDEMHEPRLVHEMFGRYRDDVWQMPLRWIVCGLATRQSQYFEPPADAFFESVITVAPLSDTASMSLLQARLAEAGEAETETAVRVISDGDAIIERGSGNPRRLLAAARDTVLRSPEEAAAANSLVTSASVMGTTELRVMRYLLQHGPTSASDMRLLDSLRVTRPRATQVLRRLEEADLVYAFREKVGIGRPRKLYGIRLSHKLTS